MSNLAANTTNAIESTNNTFKIGLKLGAYIYGAEMEKGSTLEQCLENICITHNNKNTGLNISYAMPDPKSVKYGYTYVETGSVAQRMGQSPISNPNHVFAENISTVMLVPIKTKNTSGAFKFSMSGDAEGLQALAEVLRSFINPVVTEVPQEAIEASVEFTDVEADVADATLLAEATEKIEVETPALVKRKIVKKTSVKKTAPTFDEMSDTNMFETPDTEEDAQNAFLS